jgi:tetratricopeptide (TPR) repeat protein
MNNSLSSILDSAKQGNVEAIARIFNKQLNSKGITAKVSAKNTHLNILFEHATSLPKAKAVEFTKKIITNLGILKFQEIRIYGKLSDEEMPEWAEKIVLDSLGQPSIRELAQNRDEASLATLITKLFGKEKFQVKLNVKESILQMMLEADKTPQKEALIPLLTNFFIDLKVRNVDQVKIFGKKKDEDFPEWHEFLELTQISTQILNDRKSKKVLSGLEEIKLSNKIYNKIQDICYEHLLCKIDSEENKSVQEIARDFINDLEGDLDSDLSIFENHLYRELTSAEVYVSKSDITRIITATKEAHTAKITIAIRELERLTEDILKLGIPKDSDIFKSFFTGISDGITYELTGKSMPQARKEAMVGAAIGSMFVPGVGTVVGGAIGHAMSGWLGDNQQQQIVQKSLEKYEKARGKVLAEWEEFLQSIYLNLKTFLQSEFNANLLSFEAFENALDKYNEGVEVLNSEEGDFENSLDYFNEAIKLNPGFALAWNNKGFVLNQIGRYVEAIQALDKALEIDEFMEIALINKGDAYKGLNEFEEALEIYNKGISKHSDSYYLWFGKRECLFQLGLYGNALEAAEKLLEINPQDFNAWYAKAVCLVKLEKSDEALEPLSKAVEIDPDSTHKLVKDSKEFTQMFDNEHFQELMESSVGVSYLSLKKLLESGKWEEADKETAKLIGDVVEKVTGSRKISEKSIKEFPPADLNTLNSIWLKFSDGKFGFSKQQDIFQECSKDKDIFGSKVGWRIADEKERYFWIRNDDIKYSSEEMPEGQGHFILIEVLI